MRFYTDKPIPNTAGEMLGARAAAAPAIWLMAAQEQDLEGRAGNEEELSVPVLGAMPAQGRRDRHSMLLPPREGWGDSAAQRTERPQTYLAVRSGSIGTACGRGCAVFPLTAREHRDGLISASRALLPVPDPQASPDLQAAHMNLSNTEITQDQNRLCFFTKQTQKPACQPAES